MAHRHFQENNMSRMTLLNLRIIFACAILIGAQSANAEIDYSSVDVSGLQNQYQRQLQPKKQKKVVAL